MIKTNTLYDEHGLHPVDHNLYRRENVYLYRGCPSTLAEESYDRILTLHNLIDKLRNKAHKGRRYEQVINLTYQRAALSEALRILYQQILLDRGNDEKTIQEKENKREWKMLKKNQT